MNTIIEIVARIGAGLVSLGIALLLISFWRLTYQWSETWRVMHTMKHHEAEKLSRKQIRGW